MTCWLLFLCARTSPYVYRSHDLRGTRVHFDSCLDTKLQLLKAALNGCADNVADLIAEGANIDFQEEARRLLLSPDCSPIAGLRLGSLCCFCACLSGCCCCACFSGLFLDFTTSLWCRLHLAGHFVHGSDCGRHSWPLGLCRDANQCRREH